MGGIQSSLSSKDTPQVLNFILQEMFRRTDLADIYSLADPERCKRYIIVATDALESLFVKMSIRPDKKDGTLYFQSVEGIQRSMPADIRDKQTEYCRELAFFFIRIFQIFGALFLSMYDSKLPITDPSDDMKSPAKGIAFLNPKDFLGFSKPPQSSSWFGTGGVLYGRDVSFYIEDLTNPYSILNYHLIKPLGGMQDTQTPMRFEGSSSFQIPQEGLYKFENNVRRINTPPSPKIIYFFERGSRNYQISAKLNIDSGNQINYSVELTEFKNENAEEQDNFQGKTSGRVNLVKYSGDGIPKINEDNGSYKRGQTLPQVIKIMFDKVVIATLGEPPFSVVKYFTRLRYINGDNNIDQKISGTNDIFILKGQADNDSAKITYRHPSKIEGHSKRLEIQNVILRINLDRSSLGFSYKVKLDFSMSDINISTYRNMINIPTVIKYGTFNSSSEDTAPRMDRNNDSIPEFLQRIFKEIMNTAGSDRIKGLEYTREGLVKPYDSNQINESLKVKKLWELMAKDPPIKSHCVARAVQLLSVDAINGNFSKQAYSSICRLSFAYQKDGSLPTPGKPIDKSAGIYALSLLFFEGLERGAPKILDSAGYKEYLRYLKYLFERYPSEEMIKDEPYVPGQVRNPDSIPIKPSDITDKPLGLCEKLGDARIEVPKNLVGNLRSVTTDLFSQQQAHFQKAIQLIFSLFDKNSVEVEKKLKFNPRIVSGGMNEINRIAAGTRELLREYYTGCELKYREGLRMILKYERENPGTLRSNSMTNTAPDSTTTAPPNSNNSNNNNNSS